MQNENIVKINVRHLSEEDYQLAWKYPAFKGRSEVYLIQGTALIGKMRMDSAMGMANGLYSYVNVSPDDEASMAFFHDDIAVGRLAGIYAIRYDGITGCPVKNFTDEPDDRHKGTVIVDVLDFDFGIAHPRFSSVEGWGKARRTNHLRIHERHAHRRPRSSNKIKKAR